MKSKIKHTIILLSFFITCNSCFGDTKSLDVSITSRVNFTIETPVYNHSIKVNIKEFGAKGDGKTDDSDAILKALKSVKKGTVIIFGPGTYLISKPLIINRGDISLKGNKAVLLCKNITGPAEPLPMIKNGKKGTFKTSFSTIMLTGALDPNQFPVKSAGDNSTLLLDRGNHSLKAGDTIIISSPGHGQTINLTTKSGKTKKLSLFREQNFITTVKQVTGQKIILNQPYTGIFEEKTGLKVNKIIPVNGVTISGFDFLFDKSLSKSRDVSGILLYCTSNVTISDNRIQYISRSAVNLLHAYNTVIRDNILDEAVRFDSAYGYGIELNRSHFNTIKNNRITTFRHGVVLNHGNGNNLLEKNIISSCTTTGAIDLHGEYNFFNTIRDNTISSSKTAIVVGGGGSAHYNDGPYNCIIHNAIFDCEYGIELRNNTEAVILGRNFYKQIRYKKLRLTNFDEKNILPVNN